MKNIYLVGFMCTGKTSVARLLARRLKRPFVDMDALIELREGKSIAEIFKTKGEPYFRQLEKGLVAELAEKTGQVVSCGGGTFAREENIERMKKSGIVVCLVSSPEKILKRAGRAGSRPLLDVPDPLRRIADLLAARQPFYVQAHYIIDADDLTIAQTADAVEKVAFFS